MDRERGREKLYMCYKEMIYTYSLYMYSIHACVSTCTCTCMCMSIIQSLYYRERDRLSERLRNLEDEHTAVKESLVQLVTEKAATNKALTIENQRLRQKVRANHVTISHVTKIHNNEKLNDGYNNL